MVVLFISQTAVAVILFSLTGDTSLPTRIATVLAPFVVLPLVFAAEFLATIPRIHAEQVDRISSLSGGLAEKVREAQELVRKDSGDEAYDWPIASLFRHIDPRVDSDGDVRKAVGLKILDRLATDHTFVAYGRKTSQEIYPQNPTPLRQIPRSWWEGAIWTFDFLGSKPSKIDCKRHVFRKFFEKYCDVRVSRRRAQQIWPKP